MQDFSDYRGLGRGDFDLGHGSTWAMTIGAQYRRPPAAPLLFGPNSIYREIPLTAQRPRRARVDPNGVPCAEWWTINVSGSSLFRFDVDPGQQRLIGWSEILASGVPTSQALLRLRWDADDVIVNVAAGQRFSVLAPTITTSILVPDRRAVENRNARGAPGVDTTGEDDVSLVDTVVNVKVTCSDAPLGDRFARLTTVYNGEDAVTDIPSITIPGFAPNGVTAGPSARSYRVPPRARRVQFAVPDFIATPGPGIGPRFLTGINEPVGARRGQVDNWTRRFSPEVTIPADAQAITLANFQVPLVIANWTLEV